MAARPGLAARVEVSVEARAGAAGRVLLDAADGADVLVIGHRGRGAMSSAMLGSVGLHCVLHASCPVTIVRSTRAAEAVARPEAVAVPVCGCLLRPFDPHVGSEGGVATGGPGTWSVGMRCG